MRRSMPLQVVRQMCASAEGAAAAAAPGASLEIVDERTRLLNEALGDQAEGLSQRAKKRLLKKIKSDEKWKRIKQQQKELKAMAKAEQQSRKALGLAIAKKGKVKVKRTKTSPGGDKKRARSGPDLRQRLAEEFKQKVLTGYRVVIDCEFDALLHEKETRSLVQQIMFSYGANKRAAAPCQVLVTGVSPGTNVASGLTKIGGFERWGNNGFRSQAKSWDEGMEWAWGLQDKESSRSGEKIEAAAAAEASSSSSKKRSDNSSDNTSGGGVTPWRKGDLVYLTSDSPHTVHALDTSKIYIIGGIVDRNRLKGATLQKAEAAGIATARFPLQEHLKGKVTRCLALNHVFDILLRYGGSEGDWASAFTACIPGRKGYVEEDRVEAQENEQKREDEDDDEDKGEKGVEGGETRTETNTAPEPEPLKS